jgi:hypothetical protein
MEAPGGGEVLVELEGKTVTAVPGTSLTAFVSESSSKIDHPRVGVKVRFASGSQQAEQGWWIEKGKIETPQLRPVAGSYYDETAKAYVQDAAIPGFEARLVACCRNT